ncbi:C40 family peptidase [Streptomyces abyssomicinicus]|uniref:C40 family peptidase n=1 Tax=Streptomyces abyssomicinicus TaxID=574929 RepID=UPI001FE6BC4A|nr:C40 family peptidase [Streptomyces abyssomicinicus]
MGCHRRLAPRRLAPRRRVPAARASSAPGAAGFTAAVLSVAAAAFGVAPGAVAAPGEPDGAGSTRSELDRLYTEAEQAVEAFNQADERADALREEIDASQDRMARQQERVNALREQLGSLAGAEYRSGGMDPALALLLSSDPEDYLDKASVLDRIGSRQAGELSRLRGALRELGQNREEAVADLAELERTREDVAAHRRTVERKLARARKLLNALPEGERAAWERATRSGRDLPPLGDDVAATGRAAAALAAARSALGRPYVWGANGPQAFDCSGLTQWAWGRAGVSLPRTSQAQRAAGRQVPLSQARPGDLVTYRSDASHVAIYAGDGQVIHAPRPGAAVRYDPVGMLPLASVTRP